MDCAESNLIPDVIVPDESDIERPKPTMTKVTGWSRKVADGIYTFLVSLKMEMLKRFQTRMQLTEASNIDDE